MIKSFRDAEAAKIFRRAASRKLPPEIQQRAFQKLNALAAAITLDDLRLPPSNRLEALKGSREGQWSIRINDQWRLCFVWEADGASGVEIVDYHK
ncbi:MAG: type II toxin-antitoxin system RelE/ParE family toxin [Deltaproteobacteria bacterium]|nr:type II toxin-antitoxin system RelE/ParE family toxin [Deltaproteobacteria bacterium]